MTHEETLKALLNFTSDGDAGYDQMKSLIAQGLIRYNEGAGDYDLTIAGANLIGKSYRENAVAAQTHVSAIDSQVGGDHYKKLGQYQPWQVAAACMTPAELRGYMKGTVLAYLMREGDKGGDQDIEKARHTIELWQEVRRDK